MRLDVQRGIATGDVEVAKQVVPLPGPAPLQQAHLTKRAPRSFTAPASKRGAVGDSTPKVAYVRLQRDQIDMAVLDELPADERERILAELQGEVEARHEKRKAGATAAAAAAATATAFVGNVDVAPEAAAAESKHDDGRVFAFGLRYSHWRCNAIAHLRSIDVDLAEGMVELLSELLWQYTRQCIEYDRNLEDVYALLSDVRRHCVRCGSSKWAVVFDAVLALTQALVAQRYDGDMLDLRPLNTGQGQ